MIPQWSFSPKWKPNHPIECATQMFRTKLNYYLITHNFADNSQHVMLTMPCDLLFSSLSLLLYLRP